MFLRLLDSPLISADSPRAATMTSAWLAVLTASAMRASAGRWSLSSGLPNIPALSSNRLSAFRLEPLLYIIFVPSPATSFNPCNKEMDFEKFAATLQVPVIFSLLSARGPNSAIVPPFFNGNTEPWFFSNTKQSAAILRAVLRFSAVKISVAALFSSQYLYGPLNRPSLYFASSTLRQASSV